MPVERRGQRDVHPHYAFDEEFAEANVRRQFVSRVFLWVSAMLIPPFIMAFLPHMNDDLMECVYRYYLVFSLVGAFGYLVSSIAIFCSACTRKSRIVSLLFVAILSLSMGLMCMTIASRFRVVVPLVALGVTFVVVLLVAALARFGPCDITGCGMLLCILAIVVSLFGVVVTVMMFVYPIPILHTVFSFVSVVLFVLFLWYDLQLILGGRRVEMSPDDHILAAAVLFVDIIMIFYSLIAGFGAVFSND